MTVISHMSCLWLYDMIWIAVMIVRKHRCDDHYHYHNPHPFLLHPSMGKSASSKRLWRLDPTGFHKDRRKVNLAPPGDKWLMSHAPDMFFWIGTNGSCWKWYNSWSEMIFSNYDFWISGHPRCIVIVLYLNFLDFKQVQIQQMMKPGQ